MLRSALSPVRSPPSETRSPTSSENDMDWVIRRMSWHKDRDEARLSFAERRSVRRAIPKGRPIADPRLRRDAVTRLRHYRRRYEGLQRQLEKDRRRKHTWLLFLVPVGWGLVFLLVGPSSTPKIVAAAVMFSFGLGFLLLPLVRPNCIRHAQRTLDHLAHLDQVYEENPGHIDNH